ncbi:MAG: hypothetical protein WBA17_03140 [Saprospiraceae bacterium]
MRATLNSIFDVRSGEWGRVLLMQLQVFLLIAVLLVTKPAANGLFLAEYGPRFLPYMFIAAALWAAVISTVYSKLLNRFSLLRLNIWSLAVSLVLLLLFISLLSVSRAHVAFWFYLWVALFGLLSASQFWMMANLVFDIRQAKRLFGFIGAGAIAGGITGGYLVSLLTPLIGTQGILLVGAGLLLPCPFISYFIYGRYVSREQRDSVRGLGGNKRVTDSTPFSLLRGSRHLMYLAAIVGIGVLVAKMVDYQFSALASDLYQEEDRLTAFFGFWFSTFNVIALLIQLLVTRRVVHRVGVTGAMLFLPGGIALGSMMMIFIPGLGAAIVARLADGALKQSINRAASEMLFLPLPEDLKNRTKTFIDVFVDSAAGGLSGLLLVVLIDGLGLSPIELTPAILIGVALWVFFIFLVRGEYMDSFRSQLVGLSKKTDKKRFRSNHKAVLDGLLRVLDMGEIAGENRLLYVLDQAGNLRDERFTAPIRKLLYHESPIIRARALRTLYLYPKADPVVEEEANRMLSDESPRVRIAAFDYLLARAPERMSYTIEGYLDSNDPAIAGPALVSIISETVGNPAMRERLRVEQRLDEHLAALEEMPPAEATRWAPHLLQAAGRAGTTESLSFIGEMLESTDEESVKQAILAAGESRRREWVSPLIHLLSNGVYRPYASAALVQYGAKLFSLLPEMMKQGQLPIEDARRLPDVLERINRQEAVDFLFGFISDYHYNDLALRMEALRSLNAMRRDFPQLVFPGDRVFRLITEEARLYEDSLQTLLIQEQRELPQNPAIRKARTNLADLLRHRLEGNLDRLFRSLGLRYQPEDIVPIFESIKEGDHRLRLSALEFLDNLLENQLKRLLVPLVESTILPEEGARPLRRLSDEELDLRERECFLHLLSGRDYRLQLAVLELMEQDPRPNNFELLLQFSQSPVEAIREQALRALVATKRVNRPRRRKRLRLPLGRGGE